MPRNSNGQFYFDPGTEAVKDEVAYSAHVNQRNENIKADLNTPRPVLYGGTGASTAAQARTNLGVRAATDTPSLTLANTYQAGASFEGIITVGASTDTKIRLQGTARALVEAYNTTGSRTGLLLFDNVDNVIRLYLDASGANPAVRLELNRDGTLKINGQAVYHTGNKPTAADVGGLPVGGTAANSALLNGLNSTQFLRSDATAVDATRFGGALPSAYAAAARTITAGTGLTGGGSIAADRTISADLATQEEAQTGGNNTKLMTPLRTREAINAVSLGRGQTWQNPSRAANTTYQNSTSSPIQVILAMVTNSNATVKVGATAGALVTIFGDSDWDRHPLSFIVPPGHHYRLESSDSIFSWTELR